jgi:hypothetical protein
MSTEIFEKKTISKKYSSERYEHFYTKNGMKVYWSEAGDIIMQIGLYF